MADGLDSAESAAIALKELGLMIRRAREIKDISQFCLAKELGLSTGQSISNIERGIVAVPKPHIRPICKILGLNTEEVIDRVVSVERTRLRSMGVIR